jgi:hypothetical protein
LTRPSPLTWIRITRRTLKSTRRLRRKRTRRQLRHGDFADVAKTSGYGAIFTQTNHARNWQGSVIRCGAALHTLCAHARSIAAWASRTKLLRVLDSSRSRHNSSPRRSTHYDVRRSTPRHCGQCQKAATTKQATSNRGTKILPAQMHTQTILAGSVKDSSLHFRPVRRGEAPYPRWGCRISSLNISYHRDSGRPVVSSGAGFRAAGEGAALTAGGSAAVGAPDTCPPIT